MCFVVVPQREEVERHVLSVDPIPLLVPQYVSSVVRLELQGAFSRQIQDKFISDILI